eukprot:Rmarinus@m.16013
MRIVHRGVRAHCNMYSPSSTALDMIIVCCSENGDIDTAIQIMQQSGVRPSIASCNRVLRGCIAREDRTSAANVLQQLRLSGIPPNMETESLSQEIRDLAPASGGDGPHESLFHKDFLSFLDQ